MDYLFYCLYFKKSFKLDLTITKLMTNMIYLGLIKLFLTINITITKGNVNPHKNIYINIFIENLLLN